MPDSREVVLWLYPAAEFDRWREFIGGGPSGVETFDDYRALIAGIVEDCHARGIEARLTVDEMRARLGERENTTVNRAAVLAEYAAGGTVLALRVSPNAIGWKLLGLKIEPNRVASAMIDPLQPRQQERPLDGRPPRDVLLEVIKDWLGDTP